MHDPSLALHHGLPPATGDGTVVFYRDLAEELDRAAGAARPIRWPMPRIPQRRSTHSLPDLNWVGFYFVRGQELVLGPFQGKPACVRIPLGNGVCGTAAAERRSVLVADVHAFPGHIACDARLSLRAGGAVAGGMRTC